MLRDLVVSLSLDSDSFSRNLTSINRQIQEAEREFRLAATGVTGFEKSASGARAQIGMLQQKLTAPLAQASTRNPQRVPGLIHPYHDRPGQQRCDHRVPDPGRVHAPGGVRFQAGLSKMNEQGVSSIVTLQEMGFTEVHLRDTLMRATNATDLFGAAQKTASTAWKKNSALGGECNQYTGTAKRAIPVTGTVLFLDNSVWGGKSSRLRLHHHAGHGMIKPPYESRIHGRLTRWPSLKEAFKMILSVLLLTALLMALIPFPRFPDDGGTIAYAALLYKVSKVHSVASPDDRQSGKYYDEGILIEILGFKVYNTVR